jgi:PAS domain S-box-containing protein
MTDHDGFSGEHRSVFADDQPALDRRRPGQAGESPTDKLHRMPAVAVLERVPVPTLAIDQNGTILFANTAFAAMLGHSQGSVEQLTFDQVFRNSADNPAHTVGGACVNEAVELAHRDGFTLRASMSKSAMVRHDDHFALVIFHDLTAQIWTDGH